MFNLRFMVRLIIMSCIGMLFIGFSGSIAKAEVTSNNVPLMYWPLSNADRHVTSYPNSSWTHDYLGINSGQECPPYNRRFTDKAEGDIYWRDSSIPLSVDLAQAQGKSRGGALGAKVACYSGGSGAGIAQDHEGTDIYDLYGGQPVYAVADGEIISAGTTWQNTALIVNHWREVGGVHYTWRVRYVHLHTNFPKTSGRVTAGDVLGYVGSSQHHLHFEVEALSGGAYNGSCVGTCIINPWGHGDEHVNLWIGGENPCTFDDANCQVSAEPTCQSPDTTFCDVPTSHTFHDEIEAAYLAGLFKGCHTAENGDKYFCPDGVDHNGEPYHLTRPQAALTIARWLYGYDTINDLPPATGVFPDVSGDGEHARVYELMHRDGVVNGYSDGLFHSELNASRQQFIHMIMRVLLRHQSPNNATCTFPDTSDSFVRHACDLKIVNGFSSGRFEADLTVERGAAAAMLCRAFLSACSATSELATLRHNAQVGSVAGNVCFTASNSAEIAGVSVIDDGTEVCYNDSTTEYQLKTASVPESVEFRVDPAPNQGVMPCQENGVIAMSLIPQTSGVSVRMDKCDASRFRVEGEVDILYNGQVKWTFPYASRTEYKFFDINPYTEKGILEVGEYQLSVRSSDDPNTPKLSAKGVIMPLVTPLREDYVYTNSTDLWVGCESSNGLIEMRLWRSGADDRALSVSVRKCDRRTFNQNGTFYIKIDNQRQYGPFRYFAGSSRLDVTIDPYGAFGLTGQHAYQVELYSDDQTTIAKRTGTINASAGVETLCHRLTALANPSSGGTWSASVQPNCGDDYYQKNTSVRLTATPNSGYTFGGWTGAHSDFGLSTIVAMSSDKQMTANFNVAVVCYSVSSSVSPSGSGSVNLATPQNCSGNKFKSGTTVTAQTTPNTGYTFSHWSGSLNGQTTPASLLVNGNKSITANFLGTPAQLSATDGIHTSQVRLTWNMAAGATQYRVYRNTTNSTGGRTLLNTVSGTAYADSSAAQGVRYYYWVQSVSSAGVNGNHSTVDSGYLGLATPTSVTATDGSQEQQIGVSWNPVTGADSYEVYRSTTNSAETHTLIATVNTPAYQDASVVAGQTYYYWVRASNAVAFSVFSNAEAGQAAQINVPTPLNLSATDGDHEDKIVVTWSLADSQTYTLKLYRGVSRNGAGRQLIATLSSTSGTRYEDTSTTPDEVVYYWISAERDGVTSSLSQPDSGYRADIVQPLTHFATCAANTGNNATLLIPTTVTLVGDFALQIGDEIAAFTPDGTICAGAQVWEGENLAVTVWGDDTQTGAVDGMLANQQIQLQIWDASEDIVYDNINATYRVGNGVYTVNSTHVVGELNIRTTVEQIIQLSAGWNLISSYVTPDTLSIPALFAPLGDALTLVKNNAGAVYWREFGVNQIGNWNIRDGYQVHVSHPVSLTIEGMPIDVTSTTIDLPAGWSIIPYWLSTPLAIETALASLGDAIVIVKDNSGNVYWPAFGINTIGNMLPGQGYQIYLSEPATLQYPTARASHTMRHIEDETAPAPYYETCVSRTGNNATIAVPTRAVTINGLAPLAGDEIAAFDSSGKLCVGQSIWNDNSFALTIWGDDPQTDETDGMTVDEPIQLRLWQANTATEYELEVTYENGMAVYDTNELMVVDTITATHYPPSAIMLKTLEQGSSDEALRPLLITIMAGLAVALLTYVCLKTRKRTEFFKKN
ncbi:MAG: InlB B-repeat-containing protein [Candidatus Promineifilaceae bacterium]